MKLSFDIATAKINLITLYRDYYLNIASQFSHYYVARAIKFVKNYTRVSGAGHINCAKVAQIEVANLPRDTLRDIPLPRTEHAMIPDI